MLSLQVSRGMKSIATGPLRWQSLALAGVLTTIVFLGLTAYAWTTKTDFTGMGPYLFGFLLIMLVFGFTISILYWGFGVQISGVVMLFDILGVLLFCGYIIYDTQKMIGEYGGHRYQFSVDDLLFRRSQSVFGHH